MPAHYVPRLLIKSRRSKLRTIDLRGLSWQGDEEMYAGWDRGGAVLLIHDSKGWLGELPWASSLFNRRSSPNE